MSDIINADKPLYKQLTHEQVAPSSKRDVVATLIGTVLVVLLINFVSLWYLEAYPANRGYWLVKQKWDMLLALDEPVDWLVLGDSSGNQGVVPSVLVGESGDSAVNLATVASLTMADDSWMLQYYVEEFGSPERVLIVHTYDVWERNVSSVFLARIPLAWGKWERLAPDLAINSAEKRSVLLTRYAPLYARNKTLGEVIFQGAFDSDVWFQKRFELNPDGHMPFLHPQPEGVLRDARSHQDFVSNRSFGMSDINQAAMGQIIIFAEQYAIDIYIVNSPLYEGLMEDEAFQLYYAAMQDSLRSYSEQSDHVHFLDTTAVFPADKMENVDHVIEEAAVEYSKIIADAIKELE